MSQTILIAVDSSDNAKRAVELAQDLVPGASFVLAHAWHLPTETEKLAMELADGTAFLDRLAKSARAAGESDLAAAEKQLAGKAVECVLLEGHPGKCLVEEAERRDADVIVIGSRGRGGLSSLILGSVSHYVLHHAGRPVLIAP